MKQHYKAYMRGVRMARNFRKNQSFKYYFNPYEYQSSEWYSFNIGWNDAKFNRIVY